MKKIVIFGCGKRGMNLFRLIITEGKEVAFFCDNQIEKQGTTLQGISVVSLDFLRERKEEYLIFVSPLEHEEIVNQLKNENFPYIQLYENIEFWEEQRKHIQFSTSTPEKKVIISFTSYPQRIPTLHQMVETLCSQTKKANQIILWLSKEQFPNREKDLTPELLHCCEKGLSIRFVDGDLKSHKKYIYGFKEFPEDLILTVDDDILYPADMVETLYDSYLKFPKAISCLRAHLVMFTKEGQLEPYRNWFKEVNKIELPSMDLCATGCSGILYPPNCLHEDVFSTTDIQNTCIHGDDLWLKVQALRVNTPVVLSRSHSPLQLIEHTQEINLCGENLAGRNDKQLKAILNLYPELNFYDSVKKGCSYE